MGRPYVYPVAHVDVSSGVGEGVLPGTLSVATGVTVDATGARNGVQYAPIEVSTTALAVPDGGKSRQASGLLSLSFPWSVNPLGTEELFAFGGPQFDSGVSLEVGGASRAVSAGELLVSSGVECVLEGLARNVFCGDFGVSWRKCVRWTLAAEVRLRDAMVACVCPAPPCDRQVKMAACIMNRIEMKAALVRRREGRPCGPQGQGFFCEGMEDLI